MEYQMTMLKAVLAKNIEYLLTGSGFNLLGIHTTQEQSGYKKAISDVLKVLDDMPYQQQYRYTLNHLGSRK